MRKNMAIIILSLIPVVFVACGENKTAAEKVPTVTGVSVEPVKFAPIDDVYEAVGTVRSKTTSVLSSKAIGNITAVHVREGDRVRAGQLLIEIDARDVAAQLQKAQAGAREAQAALAEVERAIDAAESAKAAAEANKALATSTFNRYQALLERRSVSQQEFDEVQARYKAATAEADRAHRMHESLLSGRGQMLAKIDQAKADVLNAQVGLGYARVISPMAGIIVAKQAEIGALAAPGVPLITVEDDSHYRLEAAVEESHIGKIHPGDQARVRLDAVGPEELAGQVAEIVPASDPATRSYTVKIDLPIEPSKTGAPVLRSGFFGRARFTVGQKQTVTVPLKAIVQRGQLVGVYVLDQSNVARLRLIKTGKQYGDRIEILSGLSDGERIVVDNVAAVSDGVRVHD
jgi:multidrug efflux pump subunit AcrA (membrane-fusion protein)